jgi:hypothetical protein
MTSYNSISKQLLINQINLSIDLLNEIKNYCFYDVKSWETINFIKTKKNRIHNLFKNYTISRANPHNLYSDDEDSGEHWSFWTFNQEDGHNRQFQALNCKYCGNYKNIINEVNYPDRIICRHVTIDDNDYDNLTVTFEDGNNFDDGENSEYDSEDDYSYDD